MSKCGHCGLEIHPSESGIRHFGTSVAHSEYRCLELLRMEIERQSAVLEKLWSEVRGGVPSMEPDQRHVAALQRMHATLLPVIYPPDNSDGENDD